MKNKELAHIFSRIADALEFQGENMFKIIAYRKASRILGELTQDIELIDQDGTLNKLPGIGKAIADKIHEYLNTGRMKKYEEIKREIPGELLDMLGIQNLGPRTLALVHAALNVKTLKGLKRAIKNGTMTKLPGMGEKKVENIRKGIELFEQSLKRMPFSNAEQVAAELVEYLKKHTKLRNIIPAGSLRRCQETVGDIDILATGKKGRSAIASLVRYPRTKQVLACGDTKGSIIVTSGVQVDLRIVPSGAYGAALQYFTGSKAHNVRLRNRAKSKGMKLSEYGLYKGKKIVAGKTETEVYNALGLTFVPPELREDHGEIEAAINDTLPRLIEQKDIKGDLQMHSTFSDSSATIEQLAHCAMDLGYSFILVTDHSQSAQYAHGLDVARLHTQWKEIDKINGRLSKMKILKGTEVDILSDGTLDYPDTVLKKFDLVIASVHQGFKKNVTERMCAVMHNPYVDIIAHPTGRLISKREGYAVDIRKVIETAAKTGTWLELNAFPDRLDLNDVNLKTAKEMGVKISIGTDAHSVDGLLWMKYGIATARRGWLSRTDVVNTYSLEKLLRSRKLYKKQ
jgi:DNA polymerase (family 10)